MEYWRAHAHHLLNVYPIDTSQASVVVQTDLHGEALCCVSRYSTNLKAVSKIAKAEAQHCNSYLITIMTWDKLPKPRRKRRADCYTILFGAIIFDMLGLCRGEQGWLCSEGTIDTWEQTVLL